MACEGPSINVFNAHAPAEAKTHPRPSYTSTDTPRGWGGGGRGQDMDTTHNTTHITHSSTHTRMTQRRRRASMHPTAPRSSHARAHTTTPLPYSMRARAARERLVRLSRAIRVERPGISRACESARERGGARRRSLSEPSLVWCSVAAAAPSLFKSEGAHDNRHLDTKK